jgi:predicted amino acid-binding ACT domain protein
VPDAVRGARDLQQAAGVVGSRLCVGAPGDTAPVRFVGGEIRETGERRREKAMARQFVVQLENRPGELAHLTRALAASRIDIRNIASVTAGSLASAFIATSDDDATREVLRGLGHLFIEGECVGVNVDDRPGCLADVSERLAKVGVTSSGR